MQAVARTRAASIFKWSTTVPALALYYKPIHVQAAWTIQACQNSTSYAHQTCMHIMHAQVQSCTSNMLAQAHLCTSNMHAQHACTTERRRTHRAHAAGHGTVTVVHREVICEAKVDDDWDALRVVMHPLLEGRTEHHVLGLEISVDNANMVHVAQRLQEPGTVLGGRIILTHHMHLRHTHHASAAHP